MEWISIEERKPLNCCRVLVTNEKHGSKWYKAHYDNNNDTYSLDDPSAYAHPPIAITHWLQVPKTPHEH